MFHYKVWVRSARFHGKEALTYSSPDKLAVGTVVKAPLQNSRALGVIVASTEKPPFSTKPLEAVPVQPLPKPLLLLGKWLLGYYPASVGAITQLLLPPNLSKNSLAENGSPEATPPNTAALPPLTIEQTAAMQQITRPGTYLLHGKTGSGKTRVYIELVLKNLERGQSSIILTPEIGLTSQLADNFKAVFGERVKVIHSSLSPAERQKQWLRILGTKEPLVVIGARSALFSPLKHIGLIVLDEAHEAAYKQEQAPRYHASRAAAYLSKLYKARLVLGSATPSVSDYFMAEQKATPIIRLNELAQDSKHTATEVVVIDRKNNELFSRSTFLSLPLINAIEGALERREQSLLYLNRRGTARLVLCENCGWQATCPHCDVPLTYHGDHHVLRCHSCSHHQKAPTACPSCGHPNIIYKTAGTKAIVSEVQRLFPSARIARFDTDNTKAERFEQHYDAIKRGDVDILIGTQLLAKGLDLPRLSTLGVILADTSLYMPDFSAEERTYQLISQVLGRVGRGHVAGRAIIQTYHPDHPVLKQAIGNNYQGFYQAELTARQQFMFPPFCHLLKLTVRRASAKSAELAAQKLKDSIVSNSYKVRVEGPAPAFYERFQNKYQWQLAIKATDRIELLKIISNLPANVTYDLDPINLL